MQNSFSFIIDHESDVPKYQQIVDVINQSIANDVLAIGDSLPSVNAFCQEHHLSRDTVFKAYTILKENGVVKSVPNKGYYIASKNRKVLLVLDTFKAYKEVLYHSFINEMEDDIITDVQFHHYNIDNFKTILNNSLGKYYKYVVMGFDHKQVSKTLAKIPNNDLLLIDWNINSNPENNYVFQDFGVAFYKGLESITENFKKYKALHFLYPTYTNHAKETVAYFEKYCQDNNFDYQIKTNPQEYKIEKGIAYLSVSDRVLGVFLEQCRKQNLEPGVDVGFLSYNDTPMKKFIYKGITVVTTDFEQLGISAAKFINSDKPLQVYVPTKIIVRDSL
ncbi:GntR family transcriptional regulator [Cellulophaga sp. E6(2014)]|uniref:GntR family transcriptional regulator n=1 Tax=Cellulophaga sp. E6(2014) TaxID=1495334 RepID=UPI000ACB7EC3